MLVRGLKRGKTTATYLVLQDSCSRCDSGIGVSDVDDEHAVKRSGGRQEL